ncbi:MAG: phosphoadenylyl-sulfate reductase [Sphingomonadaceae bacterium]
MYQSIIKRLSYFDGIDILEPLIKRVFKDRIALVSSFGAESAVLLHMAAQVDRNLPVIFIDTDKLFWETKSYRSKLVDHLGLTNIRVLHPDADAVAAEDPDGALHARNADLCCRIRKVEPLERALNGFSAWISGRKRFHGGVRSNVPTLEMADGRLKIEPLARFTAADLEAYFNHYDLPRHPLAEQGYRSIGCMPCTVKAGNDDDPRAGRWAGSGKTECGIHWTANGKPLRVVGNP